MSLINPTPGELLDRKTILRLKIEAGRRQKLDVAHFEEELRLIDVALSDWLQKDADASRRPSATTPALCTWQPVWACRR